MSGVIYLASYPKSGNTWFRTFLSYLLKEEDEEITINHLKTGGIFSSRGIVDEVCGFETSNLTQSEIDMFRHEVFELMAEQCRKPRIIKVHDAYTFMDNGTPLLGTRNSRAVYILRNPLDVAVSFSHHSGKNIDRMISDMASEKMTMCRGINRMYKQYRQLLLSWSGHVESWVSAKELPVHFVRYEDMLVSPVETFKSALDFLGMKYSEDEIRAAVEMSAFDKLKDQEKQFGFKEKPTKAESFFREGKAGGWTKRLSEEQRDRVIQDHERVMREWGYLDESGNPLVHACLESGGRNGSNFRNMES